MPGTTSTCMVILSSWLWISPPNRTVRRGLPRTWRNITCATHQATQAEMGRTPGPLGTSGTLGTSTAFLLCGATIATAFGALARSASRVGSHEHLLLVAVAAAADSVGIGVAVCGKE